MKKNLFLLLLLMIVAFSIPAFADATFSDSWKQGSDGIWRVYDQNGNMITNAWFCDDAVTANGKDVWYLLDKNGNMISAGLVQDKTGNYYSLETNHNGYYGMLRYKSGTYDGIPLELDSSHTGSFAAIKNQAGIDKLKAKYGLKTIDIDNSNIVYSSDLKPSNFTSNGWVVYSDGSKLYYKNGTALKGWQTIDLKKYYFDESTGALYQSRYTPEGYYVDSEGVWDGKEAITDFEEQQEKIAEITDDSAEVPLTWDAEGKGLLKLYGDRAVASLNSANALVAEAKKLTDRKAAVKKYYAAVGKATAALENMSYMEITMDGRPAYLLPSGLPALTALRGAMNTLSYFETFEIEDNTDITSAAFTNQFSKFNDVISVINTVVTSAR